MKDLLIIILVLTALALFSFLLPAIIGIAIGVGLFNSGNYIMGLISIVAGIAINIGILGGEFGSGGGHTYDNYDYECPNCGSEDTEGNHCFNCDEDF